VVRLIGRGPKDRDPVAVDRVERYARLAVRVGANVQEGQTLFLTAHVRHSVFAEAIVREAYAAGASFVDVRFRDERVRRALIELGPDEALTYTPPWMKTWAECQAGSATLWITGDPDPEAMNGVDGDRLGKARMHELVAIATRHLINRSVNWSTVAYPSEAWSAQIFGSPDVERLWKAVEFCTRLDERDPVEAWREHMLSLERRAARLNEFRFKALRYRGPGTDLTLGLAENARWMSALYRTSFGIDYVPNIPTEEVFTTPDSRHAEGMVRSSKPMRLSGQTVDGLELTVGNGTIIAVKADRGEDIVRGMLQSDPRAAHFGEVALVDRHSRVGQTGIMYHDMLYDENASSHIAFGSGIPQVFEGEPGPALNIASVHVDFMVGSPMLEIDGQQPDGRWVPVMHGDEWQID
jgi:aminopeptidase